MRLKVLPAIDLREGACVQLVGGAYDAERVRLPDPVAVAKRWRSLGFTELHLVDLDAATGRGSNAQVLQTLLQEGGICQVGGGVRDDASVQGWLTRGAARVVVGTRAVEDPAWLAEVARRAPNRLVVAADVKGREVVTRGWAEGSGKDVGALLKALDALPLAGVLVTAVHKEGQLQGTDLALMGELAAATRHPLYASGGVTTLEDLRALDARGVAGAIIGMALYTGALDAASVAKEFGR